MPTDSDVITNATAATSAITAGVDRAISILHEIRRNVDAKHGLFIDPRHTTVMIGLARNALTAAAETARATTWPTAADIPKPAHADDLWE